MYPLPRLARLAIATTAALVLTGCASMNVSSYVERGTDFTKYHTYAWAAGDQLATGDARLDNNPFFQARVTSSVDGQLARRGFERSASATPDLILHYHASVTQAIDTATLDAGSGTSEDLRPSVYDAGTLMLDIVDRRTNKVIWRGWAKGSMDGMIDNQDWMEERVDEAVTRIMERLPNKL